MPFDRIRRAAFSFEGLKLKQLAANRILERQRNPQLIIRHPDLYRP